MKGAAMTSSAPVTIEAQILTPAAQAGFLSASKATRSNTYNVSPFALDVDMESFNSRSNPKESYSPQKLREKAESLRDEGQLQPIRVIVRRNRNPLVVFGIGRTLAARYGIEQGILPPDWTIRYEALTGVDENDTQKLYLQNFAENFARQDLTPMDLAAAVKRMKELGLSHNEIAARTHKTKGWVSGMLRLPDLREEWREMIQSGDMAQDVGINLARMSPDEAEATVKRMLAAGQPLNMTNFRAAMREKPAESGDDNRAPRKGRTGRTIREIRQIAKAFGSHGEPLLLLIDGGDIEPLRALLTRNETQEATTDVQ